MVIRVESSSKTGQEQTGILEMDLFGGKRRGGSEMRWGLDADNADVDAEADADADADQLKG